MSSGSTMPVVALFSAALALVLGTTAGLHGQTVIPIDDFDHMDPNLPGWTLVDFSSIPTVKPWGPGIYDPNSGALRIYHSGDELVPTGQPFTATAMFAIRDETADPLFSNGFVRAKIRTDEPQNSTSTFMRADLSTATAYLLFGFTRPPSSPPDFDGAFLLNRFKFGAEEVLWNSANDGIEYLPGEDWNIELGVVGARVTGKVWRFGSAEPAEPQFTWIDPAPLSAGQIAISSDKTIGNTLPARADGTWDDIVFTQIDFAPITVDIKPSSDSNPVNLKSKGVLPVAIVSTAELDAQEIDVESLLFGDPLLINAGATAVSPIRSAIEDVTGDGLLDLTLKFSMGELLSNGVIGPLTTQAYLSGNLFDGTVIDGQDIVTIVPSITKNVPEPTSLCLLVIGLSGWMLRRRT